MSIKKLAGWCVVAAPFVAIFIAGSREIGVLATMEAFGFAIAMGAVIGVGVKLLTE